MNAVLGKVLSLILNNVSNPNATWMNRIACEFYFNLYLFISIQIFLIIIIKWISTELTVQYTQNLLHILSGIVITFYYYKKRLQQIEFCISEVTDFQRQVLLTSFKYSLP